MNEAMNNHQQEVVVLYAALEYVDAAVNWTIFKKPSNYKNTFLVFKTDHHAMYFNQLLADFLSPIGDRRNDDEWSYLHSPSSAQDAIDRSFLFNLKLIANHPIFGNSEIALRPAVIELREWLDREQAHPDLWFPSLDLTADLTCKNFDYLNICGNIAKHSALRLEKVIKDIRRIFEYNGYTITSLQSSLCMKEFFEHFHSNFMIARATLIAERLNNLRLAIHSYLGDEYKRSYQQLEDIQYTYSPPSELESEFARASYWNLMNLIRSGRHFPRFTAMEV